MLFLKKEYYCTITTLLVLFFLFSTVRMNAQCDFLIHAGDALYADIDEVHQLNLLTSLPPDAIEEILWQEEGVGNTLSCYDCHDPIAAPQENTCYTALVTDTTGCTLSDTVCLVVPIMLRCEYAKVWPNPVSYHINIQNIHNLYRFTNLNIYDKTGRRVKKINLISYIKARIDLSDLPVGIYYLEIEFDIGISVRKKIMKL